MGFSRKEYWNGLPSPGGASQPGIEPLSPASPALQVDSLPTELKRKSKNCITGPRKMTNKVNTAICYM